MRATAYHFLGKAGYTVMDQGVIGDENLELGDGNGDDDGVGSGGGGYRLCHERDWLRCFHLILLRRHSL